MQWKRAHRPRQQRSKGQGSENGARSALGRPAHTGLWPGEDLGFLLRHWEPWKVLSGGGTGSALSFRLTPLGLERARAGSRGCNGRRAL